MPRNINTREYIFNEAVRMFSEKGYEAAAVRDICKAAKINEASLYYHFESKADLLDHIIDEFRHKLKKYIPTETQIDKLVKTATPDYILRKFVFFWGEGDTEFMQRTSRIVCMEQFTNEKARDVVVNDLHSETARSLKYALDKLIENEMIPNFDTKMFSILWVHSMFSEAVILMSLNTKTDNHNISSFTGEYLIEAALNGSFQNYNNTSMPENMLFTNRHNSFARNEYETKGNVIYG